MRLFLNFKVLSGKRVGRQCYRTERPGCETFCHTIIARPSRLSPFIAIVQFGLPWRTSFRFRPPFTFSFARSRISLQSTPEYCTLELSKGGRKQDDKGKILRDFGWTRESE